MPTSSSKNIYGVYIGGAFTLAGGVANTNKIARWSSGAWSALGTGLNGTVLTLAPSPDGNLYIGGEFTNADGTYGDYLCYWNGSAFNRIGTVELSAKVNAIISPLVANWSLVEILQMRVAILTPIILHNGTGLHGNHLSLVRLITSIQLQ